MTPTEELRKKLRKLLNEKVPSGGSEADTNFSDGELDDLLKDSPNVYTAASKGWTEKTALLQGDIEKYSAGDEQYTLTSLKDKMTHAMSMANHYRDMGKESSGGVMFRVRPPEVL
ncbi:hypothetical protein DXT76_13690 [Halobacillus trueperi]|uniref:Uncharacterized protein n=1 Tax=Halobacillus trueperi TaxID=156205 RepID=A0A3D8VM03_9BACI|nr:hypothetical protein [Halobacillus trueperi]RDY70317.1 hypothetical protein DXT76_13690 [Halobacillus trueperi]